MTLDDLDLEDFLYQEVVGETVEETENDLLSAFEEDDCVDDPVAKTLTCDNAKASLEMSMEGMCFDDKNDDLPSLCCYAALEGCCM